MIRSGVYEFADCLRVFDRHEIDFCIHELHVLLASDFVIAFLCLCLLSYCISALCNQLRIQIIKILLMKIINSLLPNVFL
jgi:hypothetical protein